MLSRDILEAEAPAKTKEPRVSVLLPTFNQAAFLRRAVRSLLLQTCSDWELLIVDDGSTDETPSFIAQLRTDLRVRTWRLPTNRGFAAALNYALGAVRAPLIAYMPSDDLYYPTHLASLMACLDEHPEAPLAYAGLRHHQRRTEVGPPEGFPLQLVQVMHRRSDERWWSAGNSSAMT
jgi:glycosyltransferase involved in cell wall biosynthesis